jgi:peroxiredoxin family protein
MAEPPEKLSLVVHSGDFSRVHYALVMAAAAAAIGRPVTMFFTMESLKALHNNGTWKHMPVEGEDGLAGAMDAEFVKKGVAGFEELLTSCVELKVRFMVCEMGLRALGLDAKDLRQDVPAEITGVVTFFNDASRHGAMLFI